jgi:Flp pilus assembly protein TadG
VTALSPPLRRSKFAGLLADTCGASIIEFALTAPLLITLGMYGTEIAYMANVNMQVSQIATSVGDNASRIGQTDNSSVTPTVTEADINSVMSGAITQGHGINFATKGRIILSSLEKDAASGRQFIHWQRCKGILSRTSNYPVGTGGSGPLGQGGTTVTAPSTSAAVMFVEIFYRYDGLFGTTFVSNVEFRQEVAFLTRDDRNLTPGVTGTGSTALC